MILTFVACGPLADSPSSYSTFAPSTRVRKPSPAIPEKCTNASLPPSSGVMKPKPFSSLNHLTTPVAIQHLLTAVLMREGCCRALPSRMLLAALEERHVGGGYTSVAASPCAQPGATTPPPCPWSGVTGVSVSGWPCG